MLLLEGFVLSFIRLELIIYGTIIFNESVVQVYFLNATRKRTYGQEVSQVSARRFNEREGSLEGTRFRKAACDIIFLFTWTLGNENTLIDNTLNDHLFEELFIFFIIKYNWREGESRLRLEYELISILNSSVIDFIKVFQPIEVIYELFIAWDKRFKL